jgi:glucan 1,3-beta-glucosidase
MRWYTVAAGALGFATAANAAGTLGFSLGTKKPDGSCKTRTDYEADFDAISAASSAKVVRGYAASDCDYAKNILPAAKTKGFQVVLGIW